MLNKAQQVRVAKATESAIDCTVRVRFAVRTFITGKVVEASFLRWDDFSVSQKGRLALFKIKINVDAPAGVVERNFVVLHLPHGPGIHAVDSVDYLKTFKVEY